MRTALLALGLLGCKEAAPIDSDPPALCDALVATDIDETLTIANEEAIQQLIDPTYVPQMRPDANTAMQAWVDAGHRIIYITARGEEITLSDGRTMREATSDWLDQLGFPRSEGDLYLAPGIARVGEEARQYKATALLDLIDRGSSLRAGYGNADSDFAAFSDAGLGPESIYVIGELAGDPVGVPVPDGDAYTNHLAGLTIPEGCP